MHCWLRLAALFILGAKNRAAEILQFSAAVNI